MRPVLRLLALVALLLSITNCNSTVCERACERVNHCLGVNDDCSAPCTYSQWCDAECILGSSCDAIRDGLLGRRTEYTVCLEACEKKDSAP